MAADEDGLAAGEKEQSLVAVGQFNQVEDHPRLVRKPPRLPDLQALEGADDDVLRRRDPCFRIGGGAPVAESLLSVRYEAVGLRRALHLDDAAPLPDQVDEPAGLGLLERCDVRTILAVTGEEVVQESLRLGTLRALVDAPAFRQRDEPMAYLLTGQGQTGMTLPAERARQRGVLDRRRPRRTWPAAAVGDRPRATLPRP